MEEIISMGGSVVSSYLSVLGVVALGGLVEKLQEGGPAVRGLVLHHHCAQLRERVTHSVAAEERRGRAHPTSFHSSFHMCLACVVMQRCMYECLPLCTKRSELTWPSWWCYYDFCQNKGFVCVSLWFQGEGLQHHHLKAVKFNGNVNDIDEGLHGKCWGVSVHRHAH